MDCGNRCTGNYFLYFGMTAVIGMSTVLVNIRSKSVNSFILGPTIPLVLGFAAALVSIGSLFIKQKFRKQKKI